MDQAKRYEYALGTTPRSNKMNVHVPPPWHPGVEHHHKPCNNWKAVQAQESWFSKIGLFCKKCITPSDAVRAARSRFWIGQSLALAHIDWYLHHGGADYDEDDALKEALTDDAGIRGAIGSLLPVNKTSGREPGSLKLKQSMYDSSKYRLAWGAIDILDYVADYDANTLNVWFQDCYEWHPYYPGLYDVQDGDTSEGGAARGTNCIHAAFVEMKNQGAADFWMKGDATVTLAGIPGLKRILHADGGEEDEGGEETD